LRFLAIFFSSFVIQLHFSPLYTLKGSSASTHTSIGAVGANVGDAVGGADVGAFVGPAVGAAVGASVIADVTQQSLLLSPSAASGVAVMVDQN